MCRPPHNRRGWRRRSDPAPGGRRTGRRSKPGNKARHAVPVELSLPDTPKTQVFAGVPTVANRLHFNWDRMSRWIDSIDLDHAQKSDLRRRLKSGDRKLTKSLVR